MTDLDHTDFDRNNLFPADVDSDFTTADFDTARHALLDQDAEFHGIPLWGTTVHGIEVTQSIQYYRSTEHLTDAADRGSNNSVRLIAYKAAWVRAYVRPGLFREMETIGATVTVERLRNDFTYELVSTLSPQGAATINAASVDYDTERSNLSRTLNFVVPARMVSGTLRLTVKLASDRSPSKSITVRARLVQTLRLRAMLVSYNGPSSANTPMPGRPPITQLALLAPSLTDLQQTASRALAAMPVQANGSFASAGVVNWTRPLDDARTGAGACSVNWNALLTRLTQAQTNDGNRTDVVYYGLLPTGMPLNVPGCGFAGLGGGMVGDQGTLIHEIGHGYGFAHTPCGAAGATDPNYPAYEPYSSASIGEFGLDIRNGDIYHPQVTRDYMSYCFPQWISLYQHTRLLEHSRLAPRWLPGGGLWPWAQAFDPEHGWWPNPPWVVANEGEQWTVNPMISLIGEVGDDGEVRMISTARTRVAGQPNGIRTNWVAQLADHDGRTIARAPLFRLDALGGCGCGGQDGDTDPNRAPFRFQAFVPDVAAGASLRVLDGEKEVWTHRPAGEAPRFESVKADVDDDRIRMKWQIESSDEVEVWAQWSPDRGDHWHGLAVGLTNGGADLPLTGLPAGRILLRLQAHDGFYTTESKPTRIELPERAPEVAILHPYDGQLVRTGMPMQLSGNAVDTEGMPLPDEALTWSLNGTPVGDGREVWMATPDEGRHEVELVVRWTGGEHRRTATFFSDPAAR